MGEVWAITRIGALGSIALLGAVPGVAHGQWSEPSRTGVAVEVFLPDETRTRDMRIYAFSVEAERALGVGFWLRGAVGITVTQGNRLSFNPNQADVAFGIEPTPGLEANSSGLGTTGFLRWRSPRLGPLAPFAEGGGGLLLTTDPFPPDGTSLNFTYRYGGGLDLALSDRVALAVAFRHIHVSNARGRVPENPAYNGNGFVVAIGW